MARIGDKVYDAGDGGGEAILRGWQLQTANGSLKMLTLYYESGPRAATTLTRSSKYVRVISPTAAANAAASPRRSPRKRAREDKEAVADEPWWRPRSERLKFGKYLPFQRFNVDQVPMPFVYEMDYTYEAKGAKRVAINQLGPSLSKRQCTAQVCFRPAPPPPPPASASNEVKQRYHNNLMEQPPPCLLFRGTGKNISQYEKDAYPPELDVLWQPKAWVDRPTSVAWAKTSFKKVIEANIAAGVCDEQARHLLLQDNLDSQKQPEYLDVLSTNCRTDDHTVVPNNTDETQPVDDGLGRAIKLNMGRLEHEWLEDDANLSRWENNELTASDRRLLIAQWYCQAYKAALEGSAKRKYFEHTGGLLTADGSGDNLLKLEGKPAGEIFGWEDDAMEEEVVAATGNVQLAEGEVEPPDEAPQRPRTLVERDDDDPHANFVDDEDEDDEEDVPPAPCEPPPGFRIVLEPPSADQLAFSKEPKAPADALLGRLILFKWPVVGWCVSDITERNVDGRSYKNIEGQRYTCNFMIFYEIDQQTVKTVLRLKQRIWWNGQYVVGAARGDLAAQ